MNAASASTMARDQLLDELKTKWPLVAALGAGCLVGASGLLLVQRLSHRIDSTSSSHVSKELSTLHVSIAHLQEAIRELKESQLNKGKPPLK